MEAAPLGEADANVTPLKERRGTAPEAPSPAIPAQKPTTSVPLTVRGAPIWAK